MNNVASLQAADGTAQEILAAATARFNQYGYRKTTMAEIAHDCGMSAGNLYRYFDSKADIGAAVCGVWFESLQHALQQAADMPAPPETRLESYARTLLQVTLESCRETPHIQEMIDFLSEERRDLLMGHLEASRAIICQIIQDGINSGEFAVTDLDGTACAFQHALVRFQYPPLLMLTTPEQSEREVGPLVRLLVDGLRHR